MVYDLTPDLHMKISYIQGGQAACFNILADRKEGEQGDTGVFTQHVDNKICISNFQKGTDLLSIGSQILI